MERYIEHRERKGKGEKNMKREREVLVGLVNRTAFWQITGNLASHHKEVCGVSRKMEPWTISPKYSVFHLAQNSSSHWTWSSPTDWVICISLSNYCSKAKEYIVLLPSTLALTLRKTPVL